jgi:VanZ family protein
MALIWLASSLPKRAPFEIFPHQDKAVHLIEYAILSGLYCFAIARTWTLQKKPSVLLLASSLAALWGALDELHQAYVPLRSAEATDAIADALGALAGSWLYLGLLYPDRQKTPAR